MREQLSQEARAYQDSFEKLNEPGLEGVREREITRAQIIGAMANAEAARYGETPDRELIDIVEENYKQWQDIVQAYQDIEITDDYLRQFDIDFSGSLTGYQETTNNFEVTKKVYETARVLSNLGISSEDFATFAREQSYDTQRARDFAEKLVSSAWVIESQDVAISSMERLNELAEVVLPNAFMIHSELGGRVSRWPYHPVQETHSRYYQLVHALVDMSTQGLMEHLGGSPIEPRAITRLIRQNMPRAHSAELNSAGGPAIFNQEQAENLVSSISATSDPLEARHLFEQEIKDTLAKIMLKLWRSYGAIQTAQGFEISESAKDRKDLLEKNKELVNSN